MADESLPHVSSGNGDSGDVYSGVFEMNASKAVGLSASFVNVVGFSPLFAAIVWYERHGTGMKR